MEEGEFTFRGRVSCVDTLDGFRAIFFGSRRDVDFCIVPVQDRGKLFTDTG